MTDKAPILELVERLERVKYTREAWDEPYGTYAQLCDADDYGAEASPVNPDGPEAAKALRQSLSEIEALEARVLEKDREVLEWIRETDVLDRAIDKAADQFRFYANQHRAKGTPEGDAKARVNDALADEFKALIAARQSSGVEAEPVGWGHRHPKTLKLAPGTLFKSEAEATLYRDDFWIVSPLYLASPPPAVDREKVAALYAKRKGGRGAGVYPGDYHDADEFLAVLALLQGKEQ